MCSRILSLLLIYILLCPLAAAAQPYRRYVKMQVNGGDYRNDGKSWQTAKNNVQDAINDLAFEMRANGVTEGGEVWVAAGTYTPTESTDETGGSSAFTAFKMVSGISVYGGFPAQANDDNAASLESREHEKALTLTIGSTVKEQDYKFRMKHETVFSGKLASQDVTFKWNEATQRYNFSFPGNTYHVVWFATAGFTDGKANGLGAQTVLDGVTIEHGYAAGSSDAPQHTRRGGGIYLVKNGLVRNCIVRESYAAEMGGGVYLDNGGQVETSFVHSCVANGVYDRLGYGGGLCVNTRGAFTRCVVINNFARNGGGAALYNPTAYNAEANNFDSYISWNMVAATSVIANNTSSNEAGGLYLENGGICMQSSVVYNRCNGDETMRDGLLSGQSAGIYAYDRAAIVNTVMWGNKLGERPAVQFYNQNVEKQGLTSEQEAENLSYVQGCGIASADLTDWNGVHNVLTLNLTTQNRPQAVTTSDQHFPFFVTTNIIKRDANVELQPGVWGALLDEGANVAGNTNLQSYLRAGWNTHPLTALREKAIPFAQQHFGDITNNSAQLENFFSNKSILGLDFLLRPDIGAYKCYDLDLKPAELADGKHIFVDPDIALQLSLESGNDPRAASDGSSWDAAISSLNMALAYCRTHAAEDNPFFIHVKEGTVIPYGQYLTDNYRSATIRMASYTTVMGGYPSALKGTDISRRNPKKYPTTVDAHFNGQVIQGANPREGNAYHCVVFASVKDAVLDGFHLINGYAAPAAKNNYGAGIYISDHHDWTDGNLPTDIPMNGISIRNSRIENCVSEANADTKAGGTGAALAIVADINPAISVSVENCVFSNNEALSSTLDRRSVLHTAGQSPIDLTLNHCTVVHNVGRLVTKDNAAHAVTFKNSWFWANAREACATESELTAAKLTGTGDATLLNSKTNSDFSLESTDKSYPLCANPTRNIGASVNTFNSLIGGTPDWTPKPMNPVVNAADAQKDATDLTAETSRSMGGRADLGALECDALPQMGRTYYVRTPEDGGSDGHDGLSWQTAFATIKKATDTAVKGKLIKGARPEVWVAAGTYRQDPQSGSNNCFEILEGVTVYGAFPKDGSPGMDERHPLLSNAVYTSDPTIINDYETILEPLNPSTADNATLRVLGQSDDANPYTNLGSIGYIEVDQGQGDYLLIDGEYVLVENGEGNYVKAHPNGGFKYKAKWDGFTLRKGFLDSHNINFIEKGDNDYGPRRNGGAGAIIFTNTTLTNCIITDCQNISSIDKEEIRGGALYCDEGTVVNCYITKNRFGKNNYQQKAAYGGGAYLFQGTMYNCVISENIAYGKNTDGAAIFIENGEFYNNTVVNNTSYEHSTERARGNGGIAIWNNGTNYLRIYNCISLNNNGLDATGNLKGSEDVASNGGKIECYNTLVGVGRKSPAEGRVEYYNSEEATTDIFVNYDERNYRLNGTKGQNFGDNTPEVDKNIIDLSLFTDMDYTARIKDCRVDVGAYEFDGTFTITPTLDSNENSETKGAYVFYVTPGGAGTASGADTKNAACATKLQKVLDAAARHKVQYPDRRYVVKISAPEGGADYYPTRQTLTENGAAVRTNDPRAYALQVPIGVELHGGYNQDFTARDITTYATRISATDGQTATKFYHALVFTNRLFNEYEQPQQLITEANAAISGHGIVDGVYITGGTADGTTLADDRNGGGAFVESYGHVRRCIVEQNTAIGNGGGLYLKPGAIVSGTLVHKNTAANGGGIYVEALKAGETTPARLYTSTIVNNTSNEGAGGGLYFSQRNLAVNSSVIWGNHANMNREVIGGLHSTIDDKNSFPFAYSAVGQIRVPGINNLSLDLENDIAARFEDLATDPYYGLTKLSLLVNAGMQVTAFTELTQSAEALVATDFKGKNYTVGAKNIDIGARSLGVNTFPKDLYFRRIFVSRENMSLPTDILNAIESSGNKQIGTRGTSFYYPFARMQEALDYIKSIRNSDIDVYDVNEQKYVTDPQNTVFEIYVAKGNYYPEYDEDETGDLESKSRAAAFILPKGVMLFGGFDGTEFYWQNEENDLTLGTACTFTGRRTLDILKARELADQNGNNITEPWEFRYATTFSAKTNNTSAEDNAYHVFLNCNDPDHMGRQPDAELADDGSNGDLFQIVFDGINISDGNAAQDDGNDYHATSQNKGGGICIIEDNTATDAPQAPHTVVRHCNISNNTAGLGGGIYTDGSISLYGCRFTQNKTIFPAPSILPGGNSIPTHRLGGGSALYTSAHTTLVNCLLANNESAGRGTLYDATSTEGEQRYIINCNFVRNLAAGYPAIYSELTLDGDYVANTIFWGNVSNKSEEAFIINPKEGYNVASTPEEVRFSAYEAGWWKAPTYDESLLTASKAEVLAATANNNVLIAADNLAMNGPSFGNPATEAGINGYTSNANYAPRRYNILTDAGSGYLEQQFTESADGEKLPSFYENEEESGNTDHGGGIYTEYARTINKLHGGSTSMPYLTGHLYMELNYLGQTDPYPMHRISLNPSPTRKHTQVDIGVYEYQHIKLDPETKGNVDILFVRPFEDPTWGVADGLSWRTGTSDLQRAIETLLTMRNGHKKKIYMAEGEYAPVYTFDGNRGYTIDLPAISDDGGSGAADYQNDVRSLTIMGGFAASNLDNNFMTRNFWDTPSVLRANSEATEKLFHIKDARRLSNRLEPVENEVIQNVKGTAIPVYLDGLVFDNPYGQTFAYTDADATLLNHAGYGNEPKLTLSHCKFRLTGQSKATSAPSVEIVGNAAGQTNIINSLFHSNAASPLKAAQANVVNCTFALNGGVPVITDNDAPGAGIYNSVFWRNGAVNEAEGFAALAGEKKFNAACGIPADKANQNMPLSLVNSDAFEGPNFTKPLEDAVAVDVMRTRFFTFNPSAILIDQADKDTYDQFAALSQAMRDKTDIDFTNDNMLDGVEDKVAYESDKEIALAGNKRIYAATGAADPRPDRGAYEYNKQLERVIYVDPSRTADGDGTEWQTAFPGGELQSAIDLTAVYHHIRPQEKGYVFVKEGTSTGLDGKPETIVLRPGVEVYGSIARTEVNGHEEITEADGSVTIDATKLLNARRGLLSPITSTTLVAGITADAESDYEGSIIDGFEVAGNASSAIGKNSVLRNALVNEAITSFANYGGLLYDVLLHNDADALTFTNLAADGTPGYYVNVTAYAPTLGGIPEENRYQFRSIFTTNTNSFAPYVSHFKHRRFQLQEMSFFIDPADEVDISAVKAKFPGIINEATDFDVLGNPRLLNETVDYGCFETWSIPKNCRWTTDENRNQTLDPAFNPSAEARIGGSPEEGSVVYIGREAKLVLNQARAFRPGYLLLAPNGSLYAGTTNVEVTHAGVERAMKKGWNLFAVPYAFRGVFKVDEGPVETDRAPVFTPAVYGNIAAPAGFDGSTAYYYDGDLRAAADYRFHAKESPCWQPLTAGSPTEAMRGYAFEAPADGIYRITGGELEAIDTQTLNAPASEAKGTPRVTEDMLPIIYAENGSDKQVTLTQHNFTPADGTANFTVKENMGWNLIGLPYLVSSYALTEDALTLPRLVYRFDNESGLYESAQTWGEAAGRPLLSVGEAAFTQTAAIDNTETLTFVQPQAQNAGTGSTEKRDYVALTLSSPAATDRFTLIAPADTPEAAGQPAATDMANRDYAFGTDGLKLMAERDGAPQLYATNRLGARFAIIAETPLTEGLEVPLEAVLPANGTYTFALAADTAATAAGKTLAPCQSVVLRNLTTGQRADLTKTTLAVSTLDAATHLLTLTLGAAQADDDNADRAPAPYRLSRRNTTLLVSGVSEGERVEVFDTGGRRVADVTADSADRLEIPLRHDTFVVRIGAWNAKVRL